MSVPLVAWWLAAFLPPIGATVAVSGAAGLVVPQGSTSRVGLLSRRPNVRHAVAGQWPEKTYPPLCCSNLEPTSRWRQAECKPPLFRPLAKPNSGRHRHVSGTTRTAAEAAAARQLNSQPQPGNGSCTSNVLNDITLSGRHRSRWKYPQPPTPFSMCLLYVRIRTSEKRLR